MEEIDTKNLLVKFPEGQDQSSTIVALAPNNPVDKAADFLPRALKAIRDNFKEAAFLFILLGYIFIAALGHMERIQNYLGYFFVISASVLLYKVWDKFSLKDILYFLIILVLLFYVIHLKFNVNFLNILGYGSSS